MSLKKEKYWFVYLIKDETIVEAENRKYHERKIRGKQYRFVGDLARFFLYVGRERPEFDKEKYTIHYKWKIKTLSSNAAVRVVKKILPDWFWHRQHHFYHNIRKIIMTDEKGRWLVRKGKLV